MRQAYFWAACIGAVCLFSAASAARVGDRDENPDMRPHPPSVPHPPPQPRLQVAAIESIGQSFKDAKKDEKARPAQPPPAAGGTSAAPAANAAAASAPKWGASKTDGKASSSQPAPAPPPPPPPSVVINTGQEQMSPVTAVLLGLFPFLMALPALALWIYYVFYGQADLMKEMQEGAKMVEDLGKTCDHLEERVREQIQMLAEKQVDWSQHDFNEKKEDFLVFLDYCIESPERLGGESADEELAPAMKQLFRAWLTAFRECSRAPHEVPFEPIPLDEFDAECQGPVSVMARYIKKRFDGVSVAFVDLCSNRQQGRRVSSWLHEGSSAFTSNRRTQSDNVMKKLSQTQAGLMPNWINICGCTDNYLFVPRERRSDEDRNKCCPMELMIFFDCFKLNFISPMHTFMIIYCIVLIFTVKYCFSMPGGFIGGTVTAGAWLLTAWLLYRFETVDAIAQLQNHQRVLRQEQEDVMQLQRELDSFYQNVDEVSRIWQNRTRPRLDVMKQMMRMISETHWRSLESSKEFLDVIVPSLQRIEAGVGPLRMYKSGKFGLGKSAQSVIRMQLERIRDTIRNSDAREVVQNANGFIRCPNLLSVRVLACHQLPEGAWMDTYDPCVRLRVKKEAAWQKTECRDNQNSPRWHTEQEPVEFRFLIDNFGRELEVQVMDGNTITSDTFMGEIKVHVDDISSGGWRRIQKTLQDPIDPNCPGLIDLDVYLARDAMDLRNLIPEDPNYEITDEAFEEFMEEVGEDESDM